MILTLVNQDQDPPAIAVHIVQRFDDYLIVFSLFEFLMVL
jgi:hypothetical protein